MHWFVRSICKVSENWNMITNQIISKHNYITFFLNTYHSRDPKISSLAIPITTSCWTCTIKFLRTGHTADTRHGVTTLVNLPAPVAPWGWEEGALGLGEINASSASVIFPVDKMNLITMTNMQTKYKVMLIYLQIW